MRGQWKPVPVEVPEGSKYCFDCERVLPFEAYYAPSKAKQALGWGLLSTCKECRRAMAATHRAARRKENAAYARAYRRKNPGLWRKRREKDPEKWLAEAVAGNQRRKARERNAPGAGITRREWEHRKAEFGGRCAYCAKVAKLTMDHMDPLSKGGAHDITNVVPACRECNSGKCDRTILHWLLAKAAA